MEIRFVDVDYKNKLKNLNFIIKDNEITSIVGKNNSGKSSILKLIYGEYLPTNGKLKIGRSVIQSDTSSKNINNIRKNVSLAELNYENKLFNISILEDIKFYLGISKINKKNLDELLTSFNLSEDILTKSYLELSSGEKKKISLIQLFLKDTRIMLFNNPTEYLDSKSVQNLIKILKRKKRENKIIIIVSYDSEFLLKVSDRILAIDNGKIINDSNKFSFFTNDNLLNAVNLQPPRVIEFEQLVEQLKGIKLGYRDNINDLLKDIYRYAK